MNNVRTQRECARDNKSDKTNSFLPYDSVKKAQSTVWWDTHNKDESVVTTAPWHRTHTHHQSTFYMFIKRVCDSNNAWFIFIKHMLWRLWWAHYVCVRGYWSTLKPMCRVKMQRHPARQVSSDRGGESRRHNSSAWTYVRRSSYTHTHWKYIVCSCTFDGRTTNDRADSSPRSIRTTQTNATSTHQRYRELERS